MAEQEAIYATADDVAQILQLSPKTVYRLAANDPSFPVLKIGGSIRFNRVAVLKWCAAREQGRPA